MDVVSRMLSGPRATSAFVLRSVFEPPWAMRIEDEAPLTLMALLHGHAWLAPDTGDPIELHAGDSAVLRGPDGYAIHDGLGTETQVVIGPGQRCYTPDGRDVAGMMDLGVRTWGNSPTGSTTFLTGTYNVRGEVSERLLHWLPTVSIHRRDPRTTPLLDLLDTEVDHDAAGQSAMLDRLLDLLLIAVLRCSFDDAAEPPAWYRAYDDPVVGRAVRAIHNRPSEPWTVDGLARTSGVSRAGFARHFQEIVGEPPIAFLTGWRMALASDLLRETDATIAAVASSVGYGSAFSFSSAFSRAKGISPHGYRQLSASVDA